jgi:hypothetical protein
MAALTFDEFTPEGQAARPEVLTFEEFVPEADKQGVLGNVGMGALRGVASIGATLLRPVDAALNATGLTDMTNEERKQALNTFFADNADTDSRAFKGGEIAAEIAGTAGVGGLLGKGVRAVAPALTKLPAALESWGATVGSPGASLVEKTGNAALRIGAGATAGGVAAGMIDPEGVGTGAAIGAAFPVVGALAGQAGKGVGWLTDAVRGRLGQLKAGQIARDAAGSNRTLLEAVNANARPGLTAGQAAASVDQDMWQALAKMAERNDQTSFYRMLRDTQEAGRVAALRGVSPNLEQAQAARAAADAVNYPAAEAAQYTTDAALNKIAANPYAQQAANLAQDLINAKQIDPYVNPTGYLNAVKFGFDKMLGARGDTALGGAERQAVQQVKNQLVKWMENKNPLYAQARGEHAALSAPINQARVLEEMQNVLQRSGGGERVGPFLDVMGRGENALLKRADQSARFGGVEDVLTSRQLAARDQVAGELIRDRTMAERAAAGEGGLRNILSADIGLPRLPSFLNVLASTTNKGISALESRINASTMNAIVEGMKSGASANELLRTIPASERSVALQWIVQGGPQRYLVPAAASQSAE